MTFPVIIQARVGSTRAPAKVMHEMQGEPMLGYQIQRIKSAGFDNVVVATTNLDGDKRVVETAEAFGANWFRGSENDVMSRYLECAREISASVFYRVTGDDPLVDPQGMLALATEMVKSSADLVYSNHPEGWVYGTTAELVSRFALERAAQETQDASDREHVIPYLKRSGRFDCRPVSPPHAKLLRPDIFLSVDYPEDIHLVEQVLAHFTAIGHRYDFTQEELIELYDSGSLDIRNKHLHSGF